MYILNTYR